jgi:hypothetical protein
MSDDARLCMSAERIVSRRLFFRKQETNARSSAANMITEHSRRCGRLDEVRGRHGMKRVFGNEKSDDQHGQTDQSTPAVITLQAGDQSVTVQIDSTSGEASLQR